MQIGLFCFACFLGAATGTLAAEPTVESARPHGDGPRRLVDPQHGRVCFSSAETREKIASGRLGEPFRLLRGATGRALGETLRAKLCRWNDDYVYEIAILGRDGRIIRVYLDAASGQLTKGPFIPR